VSSWLRSRARVDRAVAKLSLIVLAPVLAWLRRRVRREDGDPVEIHLPRVGAHGHMFALRKLRTMNATAADGRAAGASITSGDDSRITPLGRRLRDRHLDELPQLVNVRDGEMLLIGPRPEAPEFVRMDDPRWELVLLVAPGLIGPTQLIVGAWERAELREADPTELYRTQIVPVKLAIDQWYVQRASPWIDVLVVVSLVQQLVFGRPETVIERRVRRDVPETAAVPQSGR
jgi:lipopolysaccharide/colanic/teichoic acid biosynthesis glycosyltransferase